MLKVRLRSFECRMHSQNYELVLKGSHLLITNCWRGKKTGVLGENKLFLWKLRVMSLTTLCFISIVIL